MLLNEMIEYDDDWICVIIDVSLFKNLLFVFMNIMNTAMCNGVRDI